MEPSVVLAAGAFVVSVVVLVVVMSRRAAAPDSTAVPAYDLLAASIAELRTSNAVAMGELRTEV